MNFSLRFVIFLNLFHFSFAQFFEPALSFTSDQIQTTLDQDFLDAIVSCFDDHNFCQIKPKIRGIDTRKVNDRLTTCLVETIRGLALVDYIVSAAYAEYRWGPIAGLPKSITDLPRYSDESQQAAFEQALTFSTSLAESVMQGSTTIEDIYVVMIFTNITIQRIWFNPKDYKSFSKGRAGKMPPNCPNQDDNPCPHGLCLGQRTASALGSWLHVLERYSIASETKKTYSTFVTQSVGRNDDNFQQKECPCSNPIPPEPYNWAEDNAGFAQAITDLKAVANEPDELSSSPPKQATQSYRKLSDEVKNDKELKPWKFVDQALVDSNIRDMCHNVFKGINNAAQHPITQTYNKGDLNEVDLTISWESGATKTADDCEKEFLMMSKNYDSDTDQYNWKWLGEVTADKIKYSGTPTAARVSFEQHADKSHTWKVLKENPDNEKNRERIGRDGKPWDLKKFTECLYNIRRHNWSFSNGWRGGKWDCANIGVFSLWGDVGYQSWEDCFNNNWPNLSWKGLFDGTIFIEVDHKGGPGPWGVKCGISLHDF